MVIPKIEKELLRQLDQLAPDQQRRVLDYARGLAAAPVRGVAGRSLTRVAGAIETGDLELIARAVEEGCEQVDLDEW